MSSPTNLQHPRFARMYERISTTMEQRGTIGYRRRLLAGLSGRVVEVGAGNGLNFGHYPETVTQVVAVEPDDHLRRLAEQAASRATVPVHVVAGDAANLPVEDGSFDAAVASLVLCSVSDVPAALAQIRWMLKPGGELRFFEHVRSDNRWLGLLQDAVAPLCARVAGGCHPNRDTAAAIRAAGFDIEEIERFAHAPLRSTPAIAHLIGTARSLDSRADPRIT